MRYSCTDLLFVHVFLIHPLWHCQYISRFQTSPSVTLSPTEQPQFRLEERLWLTFQNMILMHWSCICLYPTALRKESRRAGAWLVLIVLITVLTCYLFLLLVHVLDGWTGSRCSPWIISQINANYHQTGSPSSSSATYWTRSRMYCNVIHISSHM